MDLGVAIVGCGTIGSRRAEAVADTPGTRLVTCVDVSEERAKALAGSYDADFETDWHVTVNLPEVDIVIVSTANYLHAPISNTAMQNGKHVLCENPLARNPNEAEAMLTTASDSQVKLKTGFNNRYHNTVMKAKEVLEAGEIGKVLFIRGWSGTGGWETLSQSWFVDPELSGGGTLMDNGQNLIDLARYFMGSPFTEAKGYRSTLMWPIAPAEDNAFAVLKTSDDRTAMLHSSWTQWKGSLYLEIYGTDGYITIDLDASQTRVGKRSEHWLPVQEEVFDFSTFPDKSFTLEWQDFVGAIKENRTASAGAYDGWRAIVVAHAVYESSETGKAVRLP